MIVDIPYGEGALTFDTQKVATSEVLYSAITDLPAVKDEDEIVLQAMNFPINSPRLWELACGKKTAVIIVSDHTRPVPSKHIIPFMLRELRKGNPEIDITLLVATGAHRSTTTAELIAKLGEDIVEKERIVIHDSADPKTNIEIGVLPSGGKLVVDRVAVQTDLLVAEGFIEPHFFAGYSGGRKSVLPGISDQVTVLSNHCAEFIANHKASAGILDGNPIHEDMVSAAKQAGLAYIVNVIIDEKKRVRAAFAGDPFQAHRAGCDFLARFCGVSPKCPGDIVITSNGGYPLDQNIYQAVKGLTTAEAAATEHGVLIICSECGEGVGGEGFYQALAGSSSPGELLTRIIAVPKEETVPDQWQYQILAGIMENHHIIFVACNEVKEALTKMHLDYAATLDEAMSRAKCLVGKQAHVVVIPDGVSVIVRR